MALEPPRWQKFVFRPVLIQLPGGIGTNGGACVQLLLILSAIFVALDIGG